MSDVTENKTEPEPYNPDAPTELEIPDGRGNYHRLSCVDNDEIDDYLACDDDDGMWVTFGFR